MSVDTNDAGAVRATIVIPAYRAEKTIGDAVRSALRQTRRDIEVIVVDDGSPDASAAEALTAGAGDARLRIIRLPENRGVSVARNVGYAAAAGTWVAPLDADDIIAPERIATLVATAESLHCDILIDDLLVVTADAAPFRAFGTDRLSQTGPVSAEQYVDSDRPFQSMQAFGFAKPLFNVAFLRRNSIQYRDHLHAGEDFDLVARALLHGADLRVTPYAGYTYRRDLSTLSSEKQSRVREAIIASSRDLRLLAETLSSAAPARALVRRELETLRWFSFDEWLTELQDRRFASALKRFVRSKSKGYMLYRLLAVLRYNLYLIFGISLEERRRER